VREEALLGLGQAYARRDEATRGLSTGPKYALPESKRHSNRLASVTCNARNAPNVYTRIRKGPGRIYLPGPGGRAGRSRDLLRACHLDEGKSEHCRPVRSNVTACVHGSGTSTTATSRRALWPHAAPVVVRGQPGVTAVITGRGGLDGYREGAVIPSASTSDGANRQDGRIIGARGDTPRQSSRGRTTAPTRCPCPPACRTDCSSPRPSCSPMSVCSTSPRCRSRSPSSFPARRYRYKAGRPRRSP